MSDEVFLSPAMIAEVQAESVKFQLYLQRRCLAGARPSCCGLGAMGYAARVFGGAAVMSGQEARFKEQLLGFISDNFEAGVADAKRERGEGE